jgi:hypothetical protein
VSLKANGFPAHLGLGMRLCFGSGVLADQSICSIYFKMHLRHISNVKKIETKNSHVHVHVLQAHKVIS